MSTSPTKAAVTSPPQSPPAQEPPPRLVEDWPRSNRRRRVLQTLAAAVVAAVVTAAVILGVQYFTGDPEPAPEPTVLPEQKAITEATAVYNRIEQMQERAFEKGSIEGLPFEEVMAAEQVDALRRSMNEIGERGLRSTGESSSEIRDADYSGVADTGSVTLTVCQDATKAQLLDSEGRNVLVDPSGKPVTHPYTTFATIKSIHGGPWKLAEQEYTSSRNADTNPGASCRRCRTGGRCRRARVGQPPHGG